MTAALFPWKLFNAPDLPQTRFFTPILASHKNCSYEATSAPPAINAASARPPIGSPPPSATTSRTAKRPEQIEFFLRLHGLWEGIIQLPRPPPPLFVIEKRRRLVGVLVGGVAGARRVSPPGGRANQTMEPIEPLWQAIKEWIPDDEPDLDWFNPPRNPSNPDPDWFDQSPA